MLMMTPEPPGVRYLRGLERRQILFKLLVGPETEAFCAFLTDLAEQEREKAKVCFEYNPTSLM